jgi:hypothetical protein
MRSRAELSARICPELAAWGDVPHVRSFARDTRLHRAPSRARGEYVLWHPLLRLQTMVSIAVDVRDAASLRTGLLATGDLVARWTERLHRSYRVAMLVAD